MTIATESRDALSAERYELLQLLLEEEGIDISRSLILPQRRPARIPLSFAQQRLWFIDQINPGSPAYNIHLPVRILGRLDDAALEQAVNEIARRHETLRTSFRSEDGDYFQVIAPARPAALKIIDLTGLTENEGQSLAQDLMTGEARRPFDLSAGPLLRTCLIRLAPGDQIAMLTTHHIISDAWSMGVLIGEVGKLYEAFAKGEPSPLPEIAVQYADYAIWEQNRFQGEALEQETAYWRQKLGGPLPALDLSIARPRPAEETFNGAQRSCSFPPELSGRIRSLSRREGATLFMTLLAAFKALLFGLSGQEDIIVGASTANRSRAETEKLIGFFINTVALRTDLGGDPTFRELLGRVRKVTLEAFAHQALPFKKLVEAINPERAGARGPLARIKFVLQNAPAGQLNLTGLTLAPINHEVASAHCDLTLYAGDNAEGLSVTFEYSTDIFDASGIERMLRHFERLLGYVTRTPDVRLRTLSEAIRQEERRHQVMQSRDRLKSSLKGLQNTRPKVISLSEENLVELGSLAGGAKLPLLIRALVPDVNLAAYVKSERELLEKSLLDHGAILFRGFRIGSIAEFKQVAAAMARELLDYTEGSTPRSEIGDKIYTSTEYPPDQLIPLHNEMSYSRAWPMKIWFVCLKPAGQGGETPIADSRKIFQSLDPAIMRRFKERGVMYVRNYGSGLDLPWRQAFRTDDRAVVEAYCAGAGIDFQWRDGNVLRTRQVCQATAAHPVTAQEVWFNQAHLFHISNLEPAVAETLRGAFKEEDLPRNAYYGDGSPLEPAVLDEIREVYRRNSVMFPWQTDDILMLDNMLTAHGRMPFTGPRKIAVAMADLFTNPA